MFDPQTIALVILAAVGERVAAGGDDFESSELLAARHNGAGVGLDETKTAQPLEAEALQAYDRPPFANAFLATSVVRRQREGLEEI